MSSIKEHIFEYPECWKDEERMNVLFAPFRNRNVNPLNYDSKMEFWKKMIEKWCLFMASPTFCINDFEIFRRERGLPLCLTTVIDDMLRNQEIKYVEEFLNEEPPQQSWSGWAVNSLMKNPARWAFGKFKANLFASSGIIQDDTHFVHLLVLKLMAENLLNKVQSDQLYSLDQIQSILSDERSLPLSSVNLIIHFLLLQGKAVKSVCDDKTLVKFIGDKQGQVLTITKEEEATYILKSQEQYLVDSIEKLELEKENIVREAKSFLDRGLRKLAKARLRKKMELDKTIEKRVNVLENVQSLLSRVKEMDANSQVFETYQHGVLTLESKLKDLGLDIDKIDNTMTKIEQVLEDHSEIESTLARQIDGTSNAEFEEELAALLLEDLPDVPDLPLSPNASKVDTPTRGGDKIPQVVSKPHPKVLLTGK